MIVIQQIIDEAQKTAKARLLKADDVMNAIKDAEEKLKELGIAKKYWVGCKIIIDPESVPIVRKSSGWKLANVFRDKCKQEPWGQCMRVKLILSDVAHANIPKQYIL